MAPAEPSAPSYDLDPKPGCRGLYLGLDTGISVLACHACQHDPERACPRGLVGALEQGHEYQFPGARPPPADDPPIVELPAMWPCIRADDPRGGRYVEDTTCQHVIALLLPCIALHQGIFQVHVYPTLVDKVGE